MSQNILSCLNPASSSSPSSSSLLPWARFTSQLSKQMLRSPRLCNEAWQVLSASSPLSRLMPSSAQTSQSTTEPSVCSSWLESRRASNNQCYGSQWVLMLNKWVINTSFCLELWVKSARWAAVSESERRGGIFSEFMNRSNVCAVHFVPCKIAPLTSVPIKVLNWIKVMDSKRRRNWITWLRRESHRSMSACMTESIWC